MRIDIRYLAGVCCLALAFLTGCEDGSSGGGIADGHDFGANNPDVYVAFGDSITSGYNASIPYPAVLSSMLGKTVINKGVSGSKTNEGLARVWSVLGQYKPGYLLILYGANDIIHSRDPAQVAEELRGIIAAAKANGTIPVIATCLPQSKSHLIYNGGIIALNVRIRALAAEEDVRLVDLEPVFSGRDEYMTSDGLHPNNTGHTVIAAEFYDALQ